MNNIFPNLKGQYPLGYCGMHVLFNLWLSRS